jgi:hypothetical protein
MNKNEQLPSKIAIPTVEIPSSDRVSSVSPTQQPSKLPNDIRLLVESTFLTRNNSSTTNITDKSIPFNSEPTPPIPEWQEWWDKINQNVEVSFIFKSCIKSILNGAYKIAAQRVYDTAVRKKKRSNLAAQTPTTSNRSLPNHDHTRVRSKPQNNTIPSRGRMSQHYNTDDRWYQNVRGNNYSQHYPDSRIHESNRANTRGQPLYNNGERMADDKIAKYIPRENYCRERSLSRESSFNYEKHVAKVEARKDQESYSYSSRSHHYHDRNRYDRYRRDENICINDNDHRSLASSISTKPQNGLPTTRDVIDMHQNSHATYYDRRGRRRRRINSSYSESGSNSSSTRSRNRDRSSNKYINDIDRHDHRDRRPSNHNGDCDDHYDDKYYTRNRRRSRSRSPAQRKRYNETLPRDATTLSSSLSFHCGSDANFQRSIKNDDEPRNKGKGDAYSRGTSIDSKEKVGTNISAEVGHRHSSRRHGCHEISTHNYRPRHHVPGSYDDSKAAEQKHDPYKDGRDKWSTYSDSNDKYLYHDYSRRDISERSDTVVSRDASLPVIEVTTNGEFVTNTRKRDRRHSTPSPRKNRKSKHRRSSSHHPSDRSSGDGSYFSTSGSSSLSRINHRHHHGSGSSRKRRRHDNHNVDNDDRVPSLSSPRKRSGRKHKKRRRRTSSRSVVTDKNGKVTESDENGAQQTEMRI